VSWRDHFILQLPYAKAAAIVGLAALAYIASGQVDAVVRGAMKAATINLAIYAACALTAARLFDILSFNALWARIAAALRSRVGSTPASQPHTPTE
jgi:hypothetical protein